MARNPFVVNTSTGRRRSWREFTALITGGVRDVARRFVDPLGNIVSRRQRDQLKFAAGKRKIVSLEKRAATNPLGRTPAERTVYRMKRREAADKKTQYGGEKIDDIRRFEELKARFKANVDREPISSNRENMGSCKSSRRNTVIWTRTSPASSTRLAWR